MVDLPLARTSVAIIIIFFAQFGIPAYLGVRYLGRLPVVAGDAIERFESYFSGKLVVKLVNNLHDKIMISRAKAGPFKEWMNQ